MKHLVIEKSAIKSNLAVVKERARGVDIYADMTGDAFGMGLIPTARVLRDEGVRTFAVSEPNDADALRSAGFTEERLMMLRSTADSEELRRLVELNVICTVGSSDAAVALNGIAEARKTVCEVQIKIDTGLGRYGFMPSELDKVSEIFRYMPKLAVVGVFSTYAMSWKSRKVTLQQLQVFQDTLQRLRSMGYEVGSTHICDSAALFKYNLSLFDAVRVGTALSGRVVGNAVPGLTRVGYIEAGVEEVGWFPKGHRVGSEVLRHPAKLAVLSVGYYHGFGVKRQEEGQSFLDYLMAWRGKPTVRLGGQRVRIMGEIGMTHTIVDVTKVECHVGDVAIMDADPVDVKGIPRVYR